MTIYNWLTLFGIPGLMAALWAFVVGLWKQNKAVKLGLQALLRDRLLQAFTHYEQAGYADYDEKTNVTNMFTQYESLGKNGVMNKRYEKFMNLPDHL